jgi:hypothetical protein
MHRRRIHLRAAVAQWAGQAGLWIDCTGLGIVLLVNESGYSLVHLKVG